MSEKKDENVVGAAAIKPHGWDRSGWEAFKHYLYDPEVGPVLGRTPRSWLNIFIFCFALLVLSTRRLLSDPSPLQRRSQVRRGEILGWKRPRSVFAVFP